MKQIAGRAGRYRTAAEAAAPDIIAKDLTGFEAISRRSSAVVPPAKSLGLVTTLHRCDLQSLRNAMDNQADPIMSAGLFPPVDVLVRFAAYFPPSTPFSYILLRLHNKSLLHPRFHLCSLKDHLKIADTIEPVKNLTISDRIIFCASPASLKDDAQRPVLRAFADCVGNRRGGGILDIRALNLGLLNQQVIVGSKDYLQKLESLHKSLILYLWLSYRFAGIFSSQALAFYVKSLVEEKIQQTLTQASTTIRHVASGSSLGHDVQEHFGPISLPLAKANGDLDDAEQSLSCHHLPCHNEFGNGDTSTVKHVTLRKPSIGLDVVIPGLISYQQPWGRDSPP